MVTFDMLTAFLRLLYVLNRHLWRLTGKYHLGVLEICILRVLWQQGPLTPNVLLQFVACDNIAYPLKKLQNSGLIASEKSTVDRRNTIYTITSEGSIVLSNVQSGMKKIKVNVLSKDEIAALRAYTELLK